MDYKTWTREEAPVVLAEENGDKVEVVFCLAAAQFDLPDFLKDVGEGLGIGGVDFPVMLWRQSAHRTRGPQASEILWKDEPGVSGFYTLSQN